MILGRIYKSEFLQPCIFFFFSRCMSKDSYHSQCGGGGRLVPHKKVSPFFLLGYLVVKENPSYADV